MEEKELILLIEQFLKTRPELEAVFAYGSGVKKQNGYESFKKPQIDLIACPKSAAQFHRNNILLNPQDYSFLEKISLVKENSLIQKLGTNIYYLNNCKTAGIDFRFKMGIISSDHFIMDNLNWKNGYVSGRTQKPNLPIKTNEIFDAAIDTNRKRALIISLLLLEESNYNLEDLFYKLCTLSYMGDIRKIFRFEQKDKERNIVESSKHEFEHIYSKYGLYEKTGTGTKIDVNMDEILNLLESIPLHINEANLSTKNLFLLRKEIERAIIYRNLLASIAQPAKQFVMTPVGSVSYLFEKGVKTFKRNLQLKQH